MPLIDELDLDMPFDDPRHEAVLGIIHTANALNAAGDGLFRDHGLTEAQFNALFALKYKTRDLTQVELGKRLVVTRASVTSILDKLEGKRLVRRESIPDNRRAYHVSLTAAGERVLDEIEPLYRARIGRVMHGLGNADTQRLIRLLDRVRRAARDAVAPDTLNER